jgi:cyclophilin family peptidyl-prolyl cis-trans isomerase
MEGRTQMKRIGRREVAVGSVLLALAFLLTALPATAQEAMGSAATDGQATGHLAVLETSLGTMTFQLFPDEAPRTVANFERLVGDGFYDGLPFYRVVAGHVIQAGDGGENDQPTVPLEAGGHPHVEGALGLARDVDPDSGSTEIYVCLADRPHLDGKYAVFGQIVDGVDVLRRIGAVEVTEQWLDDDHTIAFHEPKEPVIIRRAFLRHADASETAAPDAP